MDSSLRLRSCFIISKETISLIGLDGFPLEICPLSFINSLNLFYLNLCFALVRKDTIAVNLRNMMDLILKEYPI